MQAGDLVKLFDEIGFVDTHEHIGVEDGICFDGRYTTRRTRTLWDVVFGAYIQNIFACAGEADPPQLRYNDDEEEIWQWLQPRLPVIANMGTYRALMRGLRELYDFPDGEITTANWRDLSAQVKDQSEKVTRLEWYARGAARAGIARYLAFVDPNYYREYRSGLSDSDAAIERRLVAPLAYVDVFLFLVGRIWPQDKQRDALAELLDLPFAFTWEWVEEAIRRYLDFLVEEGSTRGVKFACAYMRSLAFPAPDLQAMATGWPASAEDPDQAWVDNYQACVMHTVCRLAGDRGLPVIFHTGLGHADVTAGRPTHLLPLIDAFPGTRFVILHAAFPYTGELIAIAARRANVVFDMSWSPLLSRETFRGLFSQAIEHVQATKFLFGHDVSTAEHLVGTHRITIETIAEVLAEKVRQGYYSPTLAENLARLFARENPERLLGVQAD
jgi:predicted TIM-barrel fold metal-dependent hydrolase